MLQKVVVRSAAGRTLHADQLLPQRLCRPPTTFVWLHGLASVRRSQKSDALLGLVQKWGAGYLRVDMTGHGKSDGSLDDVTVSSWMEDVQCTLQHVAASSPLDAVSPPPRVVLVGYSLGGLVAAHVAARRNPLSHICALVLLAPSFGLAQRLQQAEVDATTGVLYLPSDYVPGGRLGVAQNLLHDLEQNHGLDATVAQALHLPIFIAHGEDDDTVAIEDVVAFHDLLGAGPTQAHLLRISGDDGDHRLNRCIGRILVELESFLRQHGVLEAEDECSS